MYIAMKNLLVITSLMILALPGLSQEGQERAKENYKGDFTYDRNSFDERETIPYPHLREADVMFSKRIQRVIDAREKQNLPIKWPKNPLNCIIYNAAVNGEITPYRSDSLISYYSKEKLLERGSTEEVTKYAPQPVERPNYLVDTTIRNQFQCESIQKFQIKEDWIFDKQSSQFYPRIIAIAPIFKPEIEGQELSEQPLFWADWEELREVLVNERMFNRHNDAMQMTYYDFFEQRLFSSYIIKQPNAFDLKIRDFEKYKGDPFAALLKAKEIKQDLFEWEHDLWQY